MDLKVKDVADLFNVSESTIRRWISDGKIPSYRINQLNPDYRFSKSEMENWLINHKSKSASPFSEESATSQKSAGLKQFSLFRAVHKGDVLHNIPGINKEDVIKNTMKKTARQLNLDPEVIIELLLDRERMMPTALSNGIAVPHTRDTLHDNHNDTVIIVFPKNELHYGALDGKPVHTLFFLFAGDDKRHLHLLAKIAHLSSQPHIVEFLKTRPSKNELLAFIKEWEGSL